MGDTEPETGLCLEPGTNLDELRIRKESEATGDHDRAAERNRREAKCAMRVGDTTLRRPKDHDLRARDWRVGGIDNLTRDATDVLTLQDRGSDQRQWAQATADANPPPPFRHIATHPSQG